MWCLETRKKNIGVSAILEYYFRYLKKRFECFLIIRMVIAAIFHLFLNRRLLVTVIPRM